MLDAWPTSRSKSAVCRQHRKGKIHKQFMISIIQPANSLYLREQAISCSLRLNAIGKCIIFEHYSLLFLSSSVLSYFLRLRGKTGHIARFIAAQVRPNVELRLQISTQFSFFEVFAYRVRSLPIAPSEDRPCIPGY